VIPEQSVEHSPREHSVAGGAMNEFEKGTTTDRLPDDMDDD